MERQPQVLVCDDDTSFHLAVKNALKPRYGCRSAYHGDEALAILRNHPVDAVILDVQMRSPDEGLKFIPKLLEADPELAIVMSSGLTDFITVRDAMRLGAADYVPKNFDPAELVITLTKVLERRSLLKKREQQNFEAVSNQRQHVLVGKGQALQKLRKTIDKIRDSSVNVVITGETGTGKEVVARQLRPTLSDGSLAPFVAVDSSTIQSSTAESILFGHEKGAFTGADRATKGIFEESDGGIVYFDEIANMPLEIQAKLLRVLQEKEITRLGSSKLIQLEFRVVCATNRNLENMSREGRFKDDLLQRLNVVPIDLPPLRDRREDIPDLVRHFVSRHTGREGALTFTDDALALMTSYAWPGNIRELSNLVAYLTAMADSPEIDVADLPPKFRDAAARSASGSSAEPSQSGVASAAADASGTFYERVARFEKEILGEAYQKAATNVSRMALNLGMDRSHLYVKLREYRIHATRGQRDAEA